MTRMLCVILLFLSVHVEYVVLTNITVHSSEPLFWFLIIWMMCSTVCLLGDCSSVTA